jgi:hypothetical protein
LSKPRLERAERISSPLAMVVFLLYVVFRRFSPQRAGKTLASIIAPPVFFVKGGAVPPAGQGEKS